MKKGITLILLTVLGGLLLAACGVAPSKNDALAPFAMEEAAKIQAEAAQTQAEAMKEAAKIEAEGRVAAAGVEATAMAEAAGVEATAIAEAAQVQAQAVLAAGASAGSAAEAMELAMPDKTGAAAKAVDLIGFWVDAGAPESDPFEYVGRDGNSYEGTYEADIMPLFSENGVWFEGQQACTGCHFANSENSYHEMDLSSYEGIMTGGDALSEPPGVPILGQSEFGATDYDWANSKLRERLRNNRMPPGWEFDITETNRDGVCVTVSADGVEAQLYEYGCELNAVGLIGAWVEAGAPETDEFEYGGQALTFERDVQPFFIENGMWFEGSQACTGCHFGNTDNSYHEMDLSTYEGMMTGGDALSEPPGVPILGQSEFGATDYDWANSKLRARLRNNRMAPGVEFDITEENRDGPIVMVGKAK